MSKFKDVFIDFNIYNNPKILEEYIEKYQKECDDSVVVRYNIILKNKDINDNASLNSIKKVIDIFKKNSISKTEFSFRIFDQPISYKEKTWRKVDKLETIFKSAHIEFGFQDGGRLWNVSEVKNTVNAIKQSVNNISSKGFSPLEILLGAYFETTKFKYTPENKGEHNSQSRSIYGVFNSNKIVCVGYSRLLETILSKLDKNNIRVFQNTVMLSNGRHSNLIVYIKDKKYNLEGYYFLDPTADSVLEEGKLPTNLSCFLVPLKDIEFMRDNIKTDFITEEYIKQIDNTDNSDIGDEHRKYNMFEGQVSFAKNNYVFDKKFLREFFNNPIQKNTTTDLLDFNLKNRIDEKLNELNKLLDNKKEFENNIDNLKNIFKENNINYIAISDLRKIITEKQYSNINIEELKSKQKAYNDSNMDKNYKLNNVIDKLLNVDKARIQLLEENISKLLTFEKMRKKNIEIEELILSNAKEALKYLGAPITLKKLKHCLKEYFKNQNIDSEEKITEVVDMIIEKNIMNSSFYYREGATNCFYKEYQKNRNNYIIKNQEVVK